MDGKKSKFFNNLAKEKNYSYLRFDCSGHGNSTGVFQDLSIKDWYLDLVNILSFLKINKNIILIGSSMGGWLATLYSLNYPKNISKLIGLAAAPDFTERLIWPNLSKVNRLKIQNKRIVKVKINRNFSYIYSHKLIFESKEYLIKNIKKKYYGSVVFFHGSKDLSVPYNYNENFLFSNHFKDIQLKTLKDEDHSLSSKKALAIIAKDI